MTAELEGRGNIDSLAWDPRGTLIAGGGSLWTFPGLRKIASIGGGRMGSVAWAADGSLLAAASATLPAFSLYDRSGKAVATLRGHDGSIRALAWSPRSRILASGSEDRTIRLWQADGGP